MEKFKNGFGKYLLMVKSSRVRDVVNQAKFKNKLKLDVFKKIFKENLKVNSEKVLIIGDKGKDDNLVAPIITNAYSMAADELGLDFETVYQNFKTRGESADSVVISKLLKLPEESVVVVNISNRIGNLGPVGLSFRKFNAQRRNRFISSSSLGSLSNDKLGFLVNCLDINYESIDKKTKRLVKILSDAREVNVSTKRGTDVTFDVDGMTGRGASGLYSEPGMGGNLPGSEAYIAPNLNGVNGDVVIDGSLRIKDRTLLLNNPVEIGISNGSISSMNSSYEARLLLQTLRWAKAKAKRPDNIFRVGELGLGLNKKADIIGSTIIDEKAYRSAHVAIGSNSWFGGSIKTFIHLDQVFRNPIVKVDGRLIKY